jgi:hypothetical protein
MDTTLLLVAGFEKVAGDVMTREQLKDVLINYTESYSKLRTALRTAGAIDDQNVWTPAGVEWARGE